MTEGMDAAHDANVEGDVLLLLSRHHPAHLALDEVIRDLERVQVEEAVRDLYRAGLLHRNGDYVFLTIAATHMQTAAAS